MRRAVFVLGRCVGCGCTDSRACVGGCAWADRGHTLCTRCLRNVVLLVFVWTRRERIV